ncbi:XRE family transcriptional regulator, partial [Bacillus paranthracis]|uniref:XRE family transcriptional regulator n=1 Tax=Bacillus paranthracis TaxID=2026186 RepID=UPI002844E955
AELLEVETHRLIEIDRSRIIASFNPIKVLCRRFHVKPKYFYCESFVTNRVNPNYIFFRH